METLQCEGTCNERGGHVGSIKKITLAWPPGKTIEFNYCEEAIREDKERGLEIMS